MNAADIGARIEARMKELDLAPIDLAAAARVDPTSVKRWFAGRSAPSSPHLAALALKLQVTTDYLVGLSTMQRSRFDLAVEELRRDGTPEEEIVDLIVGFANHRAALEREQSAAADGRPTPKEPSEQPAAPERATVLPEVGHGGPANPDAVRDALEQASEAAEPQEPESPRNRPPEDEHD